MIIARMTTVRMSLSLLINGQADYFRSKGHNYFLASGPCSHDIQDKYYTELPLVRRPHIIKDLKALIATFLWLRTIKPDILHTHTPKAGLIGMIAGFFAGVPIRIHTVAGLPWMESKGILRYVYRFFECVTYIFATRVYPNSIGLNKFLVDELPITSTKYKVIGSGSSNGIDIDYFSSDEIKESKESLRSIYQLPNDKFIWIFIGRIVKDKGVNELVSAFSKLGDNHFLLLVGPFENEQDPVSEETFKMIETNSNIRALGFQKEIRTFLKLSDALVFPSYREGFPNVPMQAAAMGLPQIVSNINGCNEIVIPDVNGLIIPKKNKQALFEAMKGLSENPELRKQMSANSRDTIVKRFSRQDIWNLIDDEYNQLYLKYKK